jgi:hypothetical protein
MNIIRYRERIFEKLILYSLITINEEFFDEKVDSPFL